MVRERRKSFFEATRRIADLASMPSQSTIVDSPKKKRVKRQDSDEPPRRSKRLQGIHVSESSLNIITHRQTRSTRSKTNLKSQKEVFNELQSSVVDANTVQPEKIKCRRVTVALERFTTEKINELLSPQPAAKIVHVSPKKIAGRRCTVNIERIDVSGYHRLPTIPENVHEAQLDDEQQLEPDVQLPEPDLELFEQDDIQIPMLDEPIEDDFDVPVPVLIEPIEDVVMDSLTEVQARQTTADANTFVNAMSSIISDQNFVLNMEAARPSTPTPTPRSSSIDAPLTPGKLVAQMMMDVQSDNSQDSNISLSRMNLAMDDDVDDDLPSTYFHAPSEPATFNRRALVPFRNRHLQSSQTDTQISWVLHRSVSDDSVAVEYTKSDSEHFSDAGIVEPKKCFIDSEHISYGFLVTYKEDTFAVNRFDHGDEIIQHHFLSKFCRSHFAALNGQFTGELYTTEITARLMSAYSNVNRSQIHILKYGEKTEIGNAQVTAIEVPNFPGGALFLFEAKNQKTIVHVGNFRLTNELELDPSLTNSDIDEIRFDDSILSGLFYQTPPCTDRYLDLMFHAAQFMEASDQNGLSRVIAFGASEIGMEFLIHRLAANFNAKVYLSPLRREFLKRMGSGYDHDTPVQKLRSTLIEDSDKALIHVLPVEDITLDYLTQYIAKKNYHRVLGIRPRGCDAVLQTVVDGAHQIVDIANPLIGDVVEYERFVHVHTDKYTREPADHGEKEPCMAVVPFQEVE